MSESPRAKIGSEHFSAWMRQGLRELRAVFYPESNVAQQPEHGLYGTKTPGEVADDRKVYQLDLNADRADRSMMDERLERMPEAEPDDDMDLEIDD